MRWKKKRNKRTHCSFSNRIVDSRKNKIERIHSKLHWNEMFVSFPCLPMNANERQVKWYVWIVQIMTLKSLKRICIVHDNYYDLYIEVMKVLLCFFSYSLSRISKFQRNKSFFEFTQNKAYKCLVKSWHMFCIFKMDTKKSEHRLLWNCGIWFAYIRVKYNQKFIPLIWCSRVQSAIYLIWYACVRFTFFLIFIFYWREEKKIRLVSWFSLYCLDLIVRC